MYFIRAFLLHPDLQNMYFVYQNLNWLTISVKGTLLFWKLLFCVLSLLRKSTNIQVAFLNISVPFNLLFKVNFFLQFHKQFENSLPTKTLSFHVLKPILEVKTRQLLHTIGLKYKGYV